MNLNPYLSFNGNCAEAFKFYEQATGGKIGMVMTYGQAPEGPPVPPGSEDWVMHASIKIGDSVIMGSDAPPQYFTKPGGFSVSLNLETPEQAEASYAALSEGGEIKMPIGETFWAQRFAMFVDKFGIPWMINCEKPMG